MTLAVGTEAPDFTLKDQNGQPVTLSDFLGTKNVLLVFFPLAFTGICQGELDQVRDHLPDYENDDTVTLVREPWTVPAEYPFGRETIVPLRAGETVRWRVAGNSPPRGVS